MTNTQISDLKVTVLAGGVGGAKLVLGFDRILEAGNLSVIVNTGDDFRHFGLQICPDLDSVCYALAGLANKTYGWGQENESWQVANALADLRAPTWFQLGDRDLATHLERTRLLESGKTLQEATRILCDRWGILSQVYPMTNDPAATLIETKQGGLLVFQDYLVRLAAEPEVARVVLSEAERADLLPDAQTAIEDADLVVFAPSNPWVSIDPILTLKNVRELLISKTVYAVSPIIQGKALKGPAAKMFSELGIEPSSMAVLNHYRDFVDVFIYDESDEPVEEQEIETVQMQTIMKTDEDKIALAEAIATHFLKSRGRL
jgi:LPPG:FO 2-phospho-L-lactate transferase